MDNNNNNTFVIKQKSFLSILASMQPMCTKRTTLDATTTISFNVGHKELVLKSTDLEISLQASYLLEESSLQHPVSFLVPGKRIFDFVKELEGTITCTVNDQQIMLTADGGVNLSLHIKSSEEFPPFPERIENLMHVDSALFLDMLDKVAFLIPQNNANPALNGLLFEISDKEFKMTTTDGHCLAQICTTAYTLPQSRTWLVPRRAISEVKKILESSQEKTVFIGICGNQLVFSGESFNFFTKLLNDTFPQYSPILEKNAFLPARVDRSHLIKTLRRSVCLLSGQFIATNFSFASDGVHVKMLNKDVGQLQESIPLDEFTGETLDLRFYAPYLLSGLQVFDDQQVRFHLKNGTKPIIFESQGTNYSFLYLVMPVAPTHAGM